MGIIAKLFLILCAVVYMASVIKLLVKQKINEKNSINWLIGVFVVLILASIPNLLDQLAILIGIEYPPSLLFLMTSLVLLYLALRQAVHLSALEERVRELAQLNALQSSKKEHSEVRESEQDVGSN